MKFTMLLTQQIKVTMKYGKLKTLEDTNSCFFFVVWCLQYTIKVTLAGKVFTK